MQIKLDERQERIVASARAFAKDVLAPRAAGHDASGVFSRDLIDSMARQGFLAATLPEAYGGLDLDPLAYGLLIEAIEQGDCAASRLITVHLALSAQSILKYGSEAQRARWLPDIASGKTLCAFALTEPDHGSDAASITCAYEPDGDSYVLHGKKRWISFSGVADLLVVIARQGPTVSAFLVETKSPGVACVPITGLMAGRACHICEIELDGVRVPKDQMLGNEGQGFTYIVNTAMDNGRYSIAWSGVGLAKAAVHAMVRYAKKREQFGVKLARHELIRGMIADGVTNLYAARSLCLRAAQSRKEGAADAIVESTIAKQFSAITAFRIAVDAVQVHGGNGCCADYPAERLMREAKALEIIEGTTQIQQMMISLHGLRQFG
jgi:alkylation response protein AidB-like acyl-CoA dehydrogenase